MHPRRYEIGSDGRIVLVGLNADETLEFELLDQSFSADNDLDEFVGQPSAERLLDWLELYHRQYKAMESPLPETSTSFATDPFPPWTSRFDQVSPTRLQPQRMRPATQPRLAIVAMMLTGLVILFVAGVTLII